MKQNWLSAERKGWVGAYVLSLLAHGLVGGILLWADARPESASSNPAIIEVELLDTVRLPPQGLAHLRSRDMIAHVPARDVRQGAGGERLEAETAGWRRNTSTPDTPSLPDFSLEHSSSLAALALPPPRAMADSNREEAEGLGERHNVKLLPTIPRHQQPLVASTSDNPQAVVREMGDQKVWNQREKEEWVGIELPELPATSALTGQREDDGREVARSELAHGAETPLEEKGQGPKGEGMNPRGSPALCCFQPPGKGAELVQPAGPWQRDAQTGSVNGAGRDVGVGGHRDKGAGEHGDLFAAGQGKGVGEPDGRLAEYLQALYRRIIKHASYPIRARRLGMEGAVKVALVLGCDGHLFDIELVRRSPFTVLNMAAFETVNKVIPLPPPPVGTCQERMRVRVPFTYRLER